MVLDSDFAEPAPSFGRLRNSDHTFLTVDRHCCVQCRRSGAEVVEQLARVRTLHQGRLEQLRIIGSRVAFRLPFANDRQHLDLLDGLRPERKPREVPVIQIGTVMPSQDVAGGIDDDLAVVDFDPLRMGRVSPRMTSAPASMRSWACATMPRPGL
jgi:hypothetical protein